uniref:Galectin n=1 Tax=Astyanax mexicanus TaxID=7994 RepID=A0A3B1KIV1_ASTMX
TSRNSVSYRPVSVSLRSPPILFAINFKTGSSDGDDVALHFKPCIGQKVTLNSFRNGKWESEESASAEPFTRGAPFTMFFAINTEGYEVFVNGVKHCMFKHRIPVEKVSTLNIGGDVSLNMIVNNKTQQTRSTNI